MAYPKNRAARGEGLSSAERMRRWREANPERNKKIQRKGHLKWKFGITLEEYNAMFASQGGRCAICGRTEETELSIDHSHVTGNNRGLLCRQCNAALGAFGDSIETLLAAIEYLKRY